MLVNKQGPRAAAFLLAVAGLCFHSNLLAEHGRNFAGAYHLSNIHSDGQDVHFDLSLKLFNYSGVDLKDATLTFEDRFASPDAATLDYQGSLEHVALKYRKYVDLKGTFAVPEAEYRRWQQGSMPELVVAYANEAGNTVHNSVELSLSR